MNYALLSKQLTKDINNFIVEYDGETCFNMGGFVTHCQNVFNSVEGGYIHALMLMQINGYKDNADTFKGMPILA